MLSRFNTPDARDGIFLAALGGIAFALALNFHMPGNIALSPAVFPIIVSVVLVLLALRLILREAGASGRSDIPAKAGAVAAVFALCIAYAAAMQRIGFIISTALYLFVFLLILGERRKTIILLLPVITAAGVYLFFEKALSVMLP